MTVIEKPVGLQDMRYDAIYTRLDVGYQEHLAGTSKPMNDVFSILEQE